VTEIHVDESVQLTQDIPELGLHQGDIGIVCSAWFGTENAYEVEFQKYNPDFRMRALLKLGQISLNRNDNSQHRHGDNQ
jgi:hypothetical protein